MHSAFPVELTDAATKGYVKAVISTSFSNFSTASFSNSALLTDSKIWIGDRNGKAQERSISGDISITNTGVVTVAKLAGRAVDSVAPSSNNVQNGIIPLPSGSLQLMGALHLRVTPM